MHANLTPEKIDLMDRYLDHELSDQETEAFEKALEEQPEMLGELREYSMFRNSLRFITAQKDFSEAEETYFKYRNNPKSRIVKLLRVITWLLIILTLFVGYLVFSRNDLFEIFLHSFEK
ncbi:MAG: zf-HC2 domain-containing protein [Solitalea sp.]